MDSVKSVKIFNGSQCIAELADNVNMWLDPRSCKYWDTASDVKLFELASGDGTGYLNLNGEQFEDCTVVIGFE